MRVSILVLCFMAASACRSAGPFGPSIPLDQRFTLAPGDLVGIDETNIRVQFVRVSGDSRCPADALCITAGDAVVLLRVRDPRGAATYDLHTGDASRAAATHRGLRIELVQLQPYPVSSVPIAPGDYRASLRVTR